ncbi:serine hydrolase [Winogradskyella sp.]|uniref:serine hydrolase n=1 Tax=Winogradskyella sp. TaxID=1883156 RepID=UPI003BAADE04
MKLLLKFIVLLLCIASCSEKKERTNPREEQFTSELQELKAYFQIPGLAVSIEKDGETIYRNYFGKADLNTPVALDSSILFPIASVTKVFSGVLIMKLVEQEKLSLNTPINDYFKEPILGDSILVKHILSHTSQGQVGKTFYYSSRFGLLTKVIEEASGKPFKEVLNEEIITPLELKNTFLLKDSTQTVKLAKPYVLDNGLTDGFIDYGYSTSAGLVSNLEDLAVFNAALDHNTLISNSSKELMFSAFNDHLPYGYGIFSQDADNIKMVWAYGQYDCYSSLFFKIPSEDITLILLANTNLLSDPARLIYGDATSSLFVLSFLKNYIYGFDDMLLFEKRDTLSKTNDSNKEFYRKKVLAQALSESFMARFDPEKLQSSAQLLHGIFSEYPNYLDYADLNLLHNLSFLKDVAYYMELGDFNDFDEQIVSIGEKLHRQDSENPYVNTYLGIFYDRNGHKEKARYYFESIVNAKNFSKNWYTVEAENWLKNNN